MYIVVDDFKSYYFRVTNYDPRNKIDVKGG